MKNKLYLISPQVIYDIHVFLHDLNAIFLKFNNHIFALQLRIKPYSNSLFNLAVRISEICSKYGIFLIINDYLDLTIELNHQNHYCGIHLGQDDLHHLEQTALPSGIKFGISCHDDIQLALKATELGADYISFGAFFPSKTKPKAIGKPTIDTLLQWIKLNKRIPTVVIGGINADNYKLFKKSPQIIIAISHYIFSHPQGGIYAVETLLKIQ